MVNKTTVGRHRRRVNGRVYQVRRHSRTVVYGTRRRNGKGVVQLRRGWRHLTARPARGKARRKWSKKKKAAMVGLGIAEILGWTLFRVTGGIVATLAVVFSGMSLMMASGMYGKVPSTTKRPPVKKVPDGS